MAVTLNMTLTAEVRGLARSPDLSPIDRPYTSSYRHPVVSLALRFREISCFVSQMSLLYIPLVLTPDLEMFPGVRSMSSVVQ